MSLPVSVPKVQPVFPIVRNATLALLMGLSPEKQQLLEAKAIMKMREANREKELLELERKAKLKGVSTLNALLQNERRMKRNGLTESELRKSE